MSTLHEFLDTGYGTGGDAALARMLADGAEIEARDTGGETPLHVATRRRRVSAVEILLEHGAAIDAQTTGGKTAYAHAARRGFDDVVEVLQRRGADPELNDADRLAMAVVQGRLDAARARLADQPGLVRTGNPEEDRLLADVAGRAPLAPVMLLIEAGANLAAPGLDRGTPLHQAAWFGQPANARALIDAGAPLDVFDPMHGSSPIGWVTHGSRYSGGADDQSDAYAALARMLLAAGASLRYPDDPDGRAYLNRLRNEAHPAVAAVLVGVAETRGLI